jgi:Fic family protein
MMTEENRQLPLEFRFTGSDYDRELDDARLTGQILRIYDLMQDGEWRTLAEIETITGDPQASISAQLRHLRKKRFGYHTVNKQRRACYLGTFEYQLIVNENRQGNLCEEEALDEIEY